MRKRLLLILIPLAVILITGAAVFFLTRPPDYLAMLSDRTQPGSCETAFVLEWINARLLPDAPQEDLSLTADEVAESAPYHFSTHYPDVEISGVRFSRPLLIEADVPTGVRIPLYLVLADWLPFQDAMEYNRTAAIMLLSRMGGVTRIITVTNVQIPANTCLKDR